MSTAAHAAPAAEGEPVRLVAHPNGCLTMSLHRPKALNALNLPMVRLLTKGLRSVQREAGGAGSKCVLVYGEGERRSALGATSAPWPCRSTRRTPPSSSARSTR